MLLFFEQKTAEELRIRDWSSDVCSSDLDWGSVLGFDWARRHRERVQGIAYMEAVTMPLEWADFPEQDRDLFQAFRSQAGEELVLQDNVFVEQVLPGLILRPLSEAEMDAYREPRSEEHTSELQSLMRISYAVFCLNKKNTNINTQNSTPLTHS